MIYSLIEKNIRLIVLLTIGIISIVFYLLKDPVGSISVPNGEVTATQYGIGMLNDSKEYFLLGSPLNDYYYHGKEQVHFSDSPEVKGRDMFSQLLVDLKDLLLNQKTVMISYKISNKDTVGQVNYQARYLGNRIEIEREMVLNQDIDQIGQSIIICQGCFVTDNRKRLYINKKLLAQDAVDFAKKLQLTPIVVGENVSFPSGASEIKILNQKGQVKMTIPVRNEEKIVLQETWNLLEFRLPVESEGYSKIKQTIYL